jgi:hypothetical protein
MKKEILLAFATAAIVLLSATVLSAAHIDSLFDGIRYEMSAERVFEGVVQERPRLFEGMMYFTMRTGHGLIAVQIGPKDFVERNAFRFQAGQFVNVVGMPVVIGNRETVLAREIRRNGSVFVIRDRSGLPIWEAGRPVEMDPELGENGLPTC